MPTILLQQPRSHSLTADQVRSELARLDERDVFARHRMQQALDLLTSAETLQQQAAELMATLAVEPAPERLGR